MPKFSGFATMSQLAHACAGGLSAAKADLLLLAARQHASPIPSTGETLTTPGIKAKIVRQVRTA
jgi:hypothetical protein